MAIDARLGEIDHSQFAADNASVVAEIAKRNQQQATRVKPASKDEQELYRLLGPDGGLPVHTAKALARLIGGLMERIAALEAAQHPAA
jgi:hypothetical protein